MPINPNAPQTPWEAKQQITQIYRSKGLPLPANIDAQARKAFNTEGAYLTTVESHAARNARNPGELEAFNRTYTPPRGGTTPITQPVFTSPGTPSTATGPLYPDEGPDLDAKARIDSLLQQAGLGSLSDWAWGMLVAGHSEVTILQELRQKQEYKDRFPYMDELRARGRAITEGEAIAIERKRVQIARRYGLPESFYDEPSDHAAAIANEESPDEFAERLRMWRRYADQVAANPDNAPLVEQMRDFYGVGPDSGEFLAMVIDVDRAVPAIERQLSTAEIGAASRRSGFGSLSLAEAERLRALGFTAEEAAPRFGELAELDPLFTAQPGRAGVEEDFDRDEQLALGFEGNQPLLARLERQARRRVSEFEGGGGFATTDDGFALGSRA